MKKLILITLILITSVVGFSQSKKERAKEAVRIELAQKQELELASKVFEAMRNNGDVAAADAELRNHEESQPLPLVIKHKRKGSFYGYNYYPGTVIRTPFFIPTKTAFYFINY